MTTRAWSAAAIAACGLLLAAWWAAPSGVGAAGGVDSAATAGPAGGNRSPGLAATATAGASSANPTHDAFFTPDLRRRLELVLLEAGPADTAAALKQRAAAGIARHFAPVDAVRATQLLERYVDYMAALGELRAPRDRMDPRALQQAMEARRKVRMQHFDAQEADALFRDDDALDRYAVARLEILRNDGLTPAQKQAALRDAELALDPAERDARRESTLHEAVAAQTAAFVAAGASDHDRYQARRAQHGEAAAQQLAQLDREDSDWQARLAQFASARASASPAEQEALRQRLFTAEEQPRIDAALALRELQKK